MKSYMTSAALLGLLLAGGCADRGGNDAQSVDDKTPPATDRPAASTAPDERSSARREGTAGARATAGPRASRPAAARAEEPGGSSSEPGTAAARRGVEWREVTIPEGTALPLELETALSSETAQVETPVRARLTQAVIVNGVTVLPESAIVTGDVTAVGRAGKVKGRSGLSFAFNQVRADNMTARIQTAPLSYVGEASKGEDATKIGAGAVGGAIVGGILGGGDGAAKGAAIGGAAGTGVVLATRGKDVSLPAGTNLAAKLTAPVTVRVPAR